MENDATQAAQDAQKAAAKDSCTKKNLLAAIPGATQTDGGIAHGGHEQLGINVTMAQLTSHNITAFKILGSFRTATATPPSLIRFM